MNFGSLDQAGFLNLLKRLQGVGGYSSDDDSARVKELNAIAKVAALVSETLETAGVNAFVSQAVEALSDYERLLYMPSDDGLTDAQRQSRLVAFKRALPKMIEARLDAAFDGYLGTTTGSTIRPEAADLAAGAVPPQAGIYVQRREASADEQEIRTLEPILQRGLPARALGGKVSTADAEFGSGSIAHKSIAATASVGVSQQGKSDSLVYPHFAGKVLELEEWRELQAMLCWKSCGFTIDQESQGRTIVVAGVVDPNATIVLDGPTYGGAGAIGWHDRFVQAWGVYSSTDVRPGGAGEDLLGNDADAFWTAPSKTGDAAGAFSIDVANNGGVSSVATLSTNAAGDLTLSEDTGDTRYFVMMIRCTPVHTPESTTDTQPWVNTTDIVHSEFSELARSVEIRDANGGGAGWTKYDLFDGEQGAVRRIIYTGGLAKSSLPAGSVGVRKVATLDSSCDWRNRYLLVTPIVKTDATKYPAANADVFPSRDSGTSSTNFARLFFTGTGVNEDNATAQGYQLGDNGTTGSGHNIWVYADSTTGVLKAEMKETDSTDAFADMMFSVTATEPIDGSALSTQVPLHATEIHAFDLNQIQNHGYFSQGFQGGVPRHIQGSATVGAIPDTPPLGLIAEGPSLPRRPVAYTVRERIGTVDDSTYQWRQPIYGQRRRIVSMTVAAGTTSSIDFFNITTGVREALLDQIDFRDRFVWVEGKHSTSDIRVRAAPNVTDYSATRFYAQFYTGPYGDKDVTVTSSELQINFNFSRAGALRGYHSTMTLTNLSASTRYVNLVVECSGYLGLTDRRLYGATP